MHQSSPTSRPRFQRRWLEEGNRRKNRLWRAKFRHNVNAEVEKKYLNPIFGCNVAVLEADTGKYLSSCVDCSHPDTPTVDGTDMSDPRSHWMVTPTENGLVVLRSDGGKCLTSCNDCNSNVSNHFSASMDQSLWNKTEDSVWRISRAPNKTVVLQHVTTGGFLSRCNQCVPGSPDDRVFVEKGGFMKNSGARWKLHCQEKNPKLERILSKRDYLAGCDVAAFKEFSGKYLSRCKDCADSEDPSTATVDGTDTSDTRTHWKIETVGPKFVALRSDNGKLLSNCEKCIGPAAYPFSTTIMDTSWKESLDSRWEVRNMEGGKVTLRNYISKKYLARCRHCAPGAPAERAFAYGMTDMNVKNQWTVECLKRK